MTNQIKVLSGGEYMKKILTKYRSICVIASALIFNLVSSLFVYKPDGVLFNKTPLTIVEWICDILSLILFCIGLLMMLFDTNKDSKEKLKEAFEHGAEEFRKVNVELKIEK